MRQREFVRMSDEEQRLWARSHALEALAENLEARGESAKEIRRVSTNLGEVAIEVAKQIKPRAL